MVSVTRIKRLISLLVVVTIITSACIVGTISASAAGTGTGLASWATNAYYSNWSYVYGGSSPGAVDCSGLIYTYNGVGGNRVDMLGSSSYSGSVGGGIPNIHGLGLWQPGHVGVYVGGGMAVDARNSSVGICYESASSSSWQMWFKVAGVSYPTTGWESFGGEYYYYEGGQYLTNTSRTIGGVSYSFGSSGASSSAPSDMSSTSDNNSSSSGGSSSSSNNNSSSSNNNNNNSSSTTPESSGSSKPAALKNGSSGDRVSKLQERLSELGFYSGQITGYFGDVTENSYKDFQSAAGVTVDGIAGESDLDLLYSSSAPYASSGSTEETTEGKTETEEVKEEKPTSFSNGDSHEDITGVQSYLKDLGYFNHDTTGFYGDVTEAAVVAFQKANDIEPTGVANAETLSLLFSGTALKNPNLTSSANDETVEVTQLSSTKQPATDATSSTSLSKENRLAGNTMINKTNEIATSAVSNLTNDSNFGGIKTSDSNGTVFVLWLLAVAGIMAAVVFLVYRNEQNKIKAKRARARAISRRYW